MSVMPSPSDAASPSPADRPRPAPGAAASTDVSGDLPDEELDVLALFTTLARTGLFLEALQRECLGEHGLAFREYSVLRLLQRAGGRRLTPSALAEKTVCTTGAMTKLVDRLERNGYVARKPDPADRRGVRVELTTSGNRLANQAARTYRLGRARVLEHLGHETAERIHEHLATLLGALEADRQDA